MVFTTNQARQFYVSNSALVSGTDFKVTNEDLIVTLDGERADLVPLKNIEYVKLTKASAYKEVSHKVVITPTEVNPKGAVVINVEVCNPAGFGDDESNIYFIAVNKATDAADFGTKALKSFEATLARAKRGGIQNLGFTLTNASGVLTIQSVLDEFEPTRPDRANLKHPLIRVWLSADSAEIDATDKSKVTYTIDEHADIPGTYEVVTSVEANAADNGNMVKAMEYFYHKERGDLYGGALWPNDIVFKQKATADKYDILDIHYFYAGPNEDVQKSGKDLTIAAVEGGLQDIFDAISGKQNITDTVAFTIDGTSPEPNEA